MNHLGIHPGQPGIVVFSKTRVSHKELYRKYLTDILIPLIKSQRLKHKIPDSVLGWFVEDGEQVQIDCMRDEELIAMLKENMTEVGKSCGSRTEVEQPCDAGPLFKVLNTETKSILAGKKKLTQVPNLVNNLEDVFKRHELKYGKMKGTHKSVAIKGLCIVRQAMEETFRTRLIIQSFIETGMYDPEARPPGVNVDTMINKCSSPFSPDETLKLWTHLPKLMKEMSLQGELLNHNFIAASFPLADEEDKDHLQLNRRRFVFLLHDRIVHNERVRVEVSKAKKRKSALAKEDVEEVYVAVNINPEDVILHKKN